MSGYGQCEECGANKPVGELIHVGIDDDGGRPFDLYRCQDCVSPDLMQPDCELED